MTKDSVTADDTGKPIVDSEGNVGIIAAVSSGTVSIESDPDITEDVRVTRSRGDADDDYQIAAKALKRNPRTDVAAFEVLSEELEQD